MKVIEVIGIVIMLAVICALGSYGQGYYAQPMTFQQANAQFFAGMAQLEQEQMRQAQAQMAEWQRIAQGGGVGGANLVPGGTGGVVFPVNNPYAGEVRQAAQMLSSWNQTIGVPAQSVASNGGLPPGVNMNDGSAQLYQSTLQSYQNIAAQNQLAYQQLDRITEDVKKIRSGNYTQADVTRWQKQAENARRVGAMADAYNSTYQMQSQQLERDQKRAANRELYNSTSKEYWQYTNRPVTPGPEQDAYDRANQVYRRW